MHCSPAGLALIGSCEGLRLDAYLDPVGIPTIGYGTTRYPDGRTVRMGDRITVQDAEAYLTDACQQIEQRLSVLVDVATLTQHQYDALVSFCYNVGLGAFSRSTLRRKLQAQDFAGAAAEFPKWNKGTIKGKKRTLPGLTARRAREKALFEARDQEDQ